MKTRVKICGITRVCDAYTAIALGADALGFVFYEKSKRSVCPEQMGWLRALPAFVSLVGLFVNPSTEQVQRVLSMCPLDILQFHGNEPPAFCQRFGKRYIKAIPMQRFDTEAAVDYMRQYANAAGFLLDNYGVNDIGGSGRRFDWSTIPDVSQIPDLSRKLMIAGGLTAADVGAVIAKNQPYAVDVSSGVETAPGIKSATKIADFISATRSL